MTRVNAGHLHIDYELRGSGPPLAMIHGFRRSRVMWPESFLSLLERHFRLVLFDNRGTGNSDKPQDGYTIEAFADDTAGLLDAIGIPRAHVFGVSMGGMIAQRIATRHPGHVLRLAIGCSHSGGAGVVPPERRIWELLRLLPDATMDARAVARRQEEAYVTDGFRAAHRDVMELLFETASRNPTPPHAVAGHLAAIEAFDGYAELGRIAAPTLVITGSADRLIVPENSRVLAGKIPGARLVQVADAAHYFWIEKPQESADAMIAFLTEGAPE